MFRAEPDRPHPAPAGRRRWLHALLAVGLALGAGAVFAGAYEDFLAALERDDAPAVKSLLGRGIDPNTPHPKLGPALIAAAHHKAYRCMDLLMVAPGIRVDAPNTHGETALMQVSLTEEVSVARRLIANGAQVNRPQWAPLHYAASAGQIEMIRFLLEEHAYIDAESPNGTTPLMMAARQKQIEAVKLLLEEGADPTQRNQSGLTAADYLEKHGEIELAKSMRERAAEFDRKYRAK